MNTTKQRVTAFLILWVASLLWDIIGIGTGILGTQDVVLFCSLSCTLSVAVMINLAIAEIKNKL